MTHSPLYIQAGRDLLLSQDCNNRELAQKAGAILAFSSGLVGLGSYLVRESELGNIYVLVSFVIVLMCFLGAAISSVIILWPREWRHGPKLSRLEEIISEYDVDAASKWTGKALAGCVDKNSYLLRRKTFFLMIGVVFLLLETVGIAAIVMGLYVPFFSI